MAAGNLDIIIEQGGTFELSLDVYDDNGLAYDMSGWTPSMKIIKNSDGVITTVAGVSISASAINISIPYSQTSGFEAESNDYTPRQIKNRDTKYAYEVSISNAGVIKKIVRGNVLVIRGI